jgi:hypothetical protein
LHHDTAIERDCARRLGGRALVLRRRSPTHARARCAGVDDHREIVRRDAEDVDVIARVYGFGALKLDYIPELRQIEPVAPGTCIGCRESLVQRARAVLVAVGDAELHVRSF